jgi:mono/diheme cytochrome c family protein
MRILPAFLVAVCCLMRPASAQQGEILDVDEVRKGHRLAITVCAICHLAAPDQAHEPSLDPPAPSFESIVQRKDFSAEWLTQFVTTTHRGLDNPQGMPNPLLMDSQVKAIVAYFLSLRK